MLTLLDVLFSALMLTAAVSDIRRYRIPNWISLWLVAFFAVRAGLAPEGLLGHLGLGFAVLAAGFGLFAANLVGAGDAKLLAAVSLWTGPGLALEQMVVTALAGGVLAAAILARRAFVAQPATLTSGHAQSPRLASTAMPYGVAIAFAGLWCVARNHIGA